MHRYVILRAVLVNNRVLFAVCADVCGELVQPVQGGASIVDPNAGRADQYPTSHVKRPQDWGKLESQVKKEEDEEQLDGDAGLQKFFKQLYSGADEDTRRAMNKSFQV
jgi:hypothetical protein